MSRSGDEMMLELHQLLNKQDQRVVTAAKKDDDDKDDKKEKADAKKEKKEKEEVDAKKEKEEAKKKKEDKKDKKAYVVMSVINDLVKLAQELDEAGAEEAAAAVDDALQNIVTNLEDEKKS